MTCTRPVICKRQIALASRVPPTQDLLDGTRTPTLIMGAERNHREKVGGVVVPLFGRRNRSLHAQRDGLERTRVALVHVGVSADDHDGLLAWSRPRPTRPRWRISGRGTIATHRNRPKRTRRTANLPLRGRKSPG